MLPATNTLPRRLDAAAQRIHEAIARSIEEGLEPWSDGHFESLALELYEAQRECVPAYRAWCEAQECGLVDAWRHVPPLPIGAFKLMRVAAHDPRDDAAVWRSSGTTSDQRSHHHLPELALYEQSLMASARAMLTPDIAPEGLTALQLVPEAGVSVDSSLSHMVDLVARELCGDRHVLVDPTGDLRLEEACAALGEAERGQRPVLLLATSFALVHLLELLEERAVTFQLPMSSRLMDTGGYKGRARELTRTELLDRVEHALGLPALMCENEYGMSELSSQAYLGTIAECVGVGSAVTATPGRWQPPWFRTQVVDPDTGNEVADGSTGLLVHCDLANAYSCAFIRSEDVGVRRGECFELVGRAPDSALRGCSLTFEELYAPRHA